MPPHVDTAPPRIEPPGESAVNDMKKPLPALPAITSVDAGVTSIVPPASQPAAASHSTQHVIQAGDSYSTLAKKYLGSSKYATLIARANPGKDPRKLQVGMKINIPPAPADAKKPAELAHGSADSPGLPAGKSPGAQGSKTQTGKSELSDTTPVPPDRAYQVKSGEGWHELAKRFLGDAKRWPELYELNRDRVPRNPEALREGTTIELPAGVKPTARQASSKPS
jgi:nucleoid-associated protein YgaU